MVKPLAGAVLLAAALVRLSAAGPLLIAHRGASGYRPEHTLASYDLAIAMGADVIEPDLVSTKDGVLIARHENEIGGTTDAASRFPERKVTKTIDGQAVTGWFTEDFTVAEIRTLRAKERLSFRSHDFDGRFAVPTFDEVMDLAAARSRELGRQIAVYPETKHSAYFRAIGLPLEEPLLAALERRGLTAKNAPVFIQSFEAQSLRRLRPLTRVRLVQLLDEKADISKPRVAEIAGYADGLGANSRLVIPVDDAGLVMRSTSLVEDAHAAGLFVHVWTLRAEPVFLSRSYQGDLAREVRAFADLGVDGIFTDFPDVAASVLKH